MTVLLLFSDSFVSDSLQLHVLQYARLPCPKPTPRACSNSCSLMPSNHLIPCCPLLLLPSVFPSIRVFSNKLALLIRWPEFWSFSFSLSPPNDYLGLTDLISLQSKGLSKVFFNTTFLFFFYLFLFLFLLYFTLQYCIGLAIH